MYDESASGARSGSSTFVEGPRSLIGEVAIVGNSVVPTTELRPLVEVQPGEPYYEPRVIQARDALSLEYLNRGFPGAAVSPTLKVSDDRSRVDVSFTVQEGTQTIVAQAVVGHPALLAVPHHAPVAQAL